MIIVWLDEAAIGSKLRAGIVHDDLIEGGNVPVEPLGTFARVAWTRSTSASLDPMQTRASLRDGFLEMLRELSPEDLAPCTCHED